MSSKEPVDIETLLREVRKKITPQTEGVSVLDFLSNKFTYRSRESWIEALSDGTLKINGKFVEDYNHILKAGEILSFDVKNLTGI